MINRTFDGCNEEDYVEGSERRLKLLLYNNIREDRRPKRSFYFVFIYGEYFDTCPENLEPCGGRGLNGIFNAN